MTKIKNYKIINKAVTRIRNQLQEDVSYGKMSLVEYIDPFTGKGQREYNVEVEESKNILQKAEQQVVDL